MLIFIKDYVLYYFNLYVLLLNHQTILWIKEESVLIYNMKKVNKQWADRNIKTSKSWTFSNRSAHMWRYKWEGGNNLKM